MRILVHCTLPLIAAAFASLLRSILEKIDILVQPDELQLSQTYSEYKPRLVLVLTPNTLDASTEKMLDTVMSDQKDVGLVIVSAGFERGFPEFVGRPSTAALLFDDAVEDLDYAIRKVITGEPVITSRLVAPVITNATAAVSRAKTAIERLAPREREVLQLIGTGRTNQEIARELSLGTTTIKSYVSRLLAKLDLRDRVECALLARQVELLNTSPTVAGTD